MVKYSKVVAKDDEKKGACSAAMAAQPVEVSSPSRLLEPKQRQDRAADERIVQQRG